MLPGVNVLFTIVCGYLVGSIPVARLLAGRDLRVVGDRNPGYWNAKEQLGRRAAVPVFAGDLAKGAIAAAIGVLVAAPGQWWVGYVGGAASMIGHAWPLFDHFRGGRSVLAFAGTVAVVAPLSTAIAVAALLVAWMISRSFAVAARVGIFGFPIVQLFIEGPYRTAATGGLMCIVGLRFLTAWSTARSTESAAASTG